MYGIYEEANASSLIMSFAAVPADCKVNPKDEIFNPITSVMNDEMTVEEWAQNVEDAFAQVRADMEVCQLNFIYQPDKNGKAWKGCYTVYAMQQPFVTLNRYIANR
ncbi:MAG: hypothetical protein ACLRVO_19410 [Blautia wexlerae]